MEFIRANTITPTGRRTTYRSCFCLWKTKKYKIGIGVINFGDIPPISFLNNKLIFYYREKGRLYIRILWFIFQKEAGRK